MLRRGRGDGRVSKERGRRFEVVVSIFGGVVASGGYASAAASHISDSMVATTVPACIAIRIIGVAGMVESHRNASDK